MIVSVLCIFLTVPWVGPWSMIMALYSHDHLYFERKVQNIYVSQFKCALVHQPLERQSQPKSSAFCRLLKCFTKGQLSKSFQCKIAFFFLSINLNMCFGCQKEPSH